MIKDRNGVSFEEMNAQDRLLAALYGSTLGRMALRILVSPVISKIAGCILSSRLSVCLIDPFIRRNGIDMTQFEDETYRSYNAFFSRRIRPDARPIDQDPYHLIAPCDSKLTVLPVSSQQRFMLKHTEYTLTSLIRDEKLAAAYEGGYALIFRLTVDDYHRYCYVADGEKGENIRIPGILHTVNPVANDHVPIYKENSREYSVLRSEVFGDILMMEVGALLVGRIVNHHGSVRVCRGEEKGYFQFGGSTVILLIGKNKVQIDPDILENSRSYVETVVKMGERIGQAKQK